MERSYFSFEDMLKTNDAGYFPYTPSVPMLHGLRCSLDLLFTEGLPNVFARHHRLAEGVRRGVDGLGLSLCALHPRWHSDTVTAIRTPEGVDATDVFRIGHLGDLNEVMCLAALASAEMALADAGAKVELGAGVAAAAEYYRGAISELEAGTDLGVRATSVGATSAPR
jgi:alanine-glyoxylate transaminase/serine-glyoxylate transaminase/serine-pyruvate transaminase